MSQTSERLSRRSTDRIPRVEALAERVFGDAGAARDWLDLPHPLLGECRPADLALTEPGARQVERILLNIEYGLPA